MTEEKKGGAPNPHKLWNDDNPEKWGTSRKKLALEKYTRKNPKLKEALIEKMRLKGELEEKPVMNDLHATYFDAQEMYDFMANVICRDIRDITIMSEDRDFYRLFKKPVYEGDFLREMFDWNCNREASEKETTQV